MDRIPLFPLNVVLMPRMPLPLHIFEERYKLMIGECRAKGMGFGIVYVHDERIESVGCSAGVEQVMKVYDDGRMDVVVRGEGRFHVETLYDEKPYLEADVDFFTDYDFHPEGEIDRLTGEGVTLLRELFDLTGGRVGIEDVSSVLSGEGGVDVEGLSFMIAAMEGFENHLRQRMIEMTSTRKRLQLSVSILNGLVERLAVKRELKRFFATGTGSDVRH